MGNKIGLKGQSGKGRMRSQTMDLKKDKRNENWMGLLVKSHSCFLIFSHLSHPNNLPILSILCSNQRSGARKFLHSGGRRGIDGRT